MDQRIPPEHTADASIPQWTQALKRNEGAAAQPGGYLAFDQIQAALNAADSVNAMLEKKRPAGRGMRQCLDALAQLYLTAGHLRRQFDWTQGRYGLEHMPFDVDLETPSCRTDQEAKDWGLLLILRTTEAALAQRKAVRTDTGKAVQLIPQAHREVQDTVERWVTALAGSPA